MLFFLRARDQTYGMFADSVLASITVHFAKTFQAAYSRLPASQCAGEPHQGVWTSYTMRKTYGCLQLLGG